jgi:hypothetical protein
MEKPIVPIPGDHFTITVGPQGMATIIAGLTVMLETEAVQMTSDERLAVSKMLGEFKRFMGGD